MSEIKYCEDCRHFRPSTTAGSSLARCANAPKPDSSDRYVWRGLASTAEFYSCATERAGHCPDDCGPSAQHFAPKDDAPRVNPDRVTGDDDGVEYADPRDEMDRRLLED